MSLSILAGTLSLRCLFYCPLYSNILPSWERSHSCAAQGYIRLPGLHRSPDRQVPAVRKAPLQEGYHHSCRTVQLRIHTLLLRIDRLIPLPSYKSQQKRHTFPLFGIHGIYRIILIPLTNQRFSRAAKGISDLLRSSPRRRVGGSRCPSFASFQFQTLCARRYLGRQVLGRRLSAWGPYVPLRAQRCESMSEMERMQMGGRFPATYSSTINLFNVKE